MIPTTIKENRTRLDGLQLAAVAGLIVIGSVFVYSATMVGEPAGLWQQYHENRLVDFLGWLTHQLFFRQIMWYALGVAAAVALGVVHYQVLSRWALVAYWATIGSLVAVLLPFIGSMRFGARRWIDLGFFQFQPSEFAKVAFILAMAHFLSRPLDELKQPRIFWKAIGLMAVPFVLIMKEPDLGSALVLVPTGAVMLYVAGTPRRYLVQLGSVIGLLAVLFLADVLFAPPGWQVKLQDYQRRRLLVYFGQEDQPRAGAPRAEVEQLRRQRFDDSHNVRQALISVGSGGLTGKGWRRGTQNALGYLPRSVAHNDFIFSVIAEEKGFVGSVTVLTLSAVGLFTGIRTAGQARDRLGRLLAVGVVTLLFSQVFINIGMNIRLMPVTGVPLPLLSYGGSAVLCSLIAIGILQNIHIHRKGY
jgi:rod shape determining protein RodA